MIKGLPSSGKNSCYFANFHSTRANEATLCSATIISATQVVLENNECWSKTLPKIRRSKRVHQTELVCDGGRVSYQFTGRPPALSFNGMILATLPQPISHQVPRLSLTKEKREEYLSSDKCTVRTALGASDFKKDILKIGPDKIRHRDPAYNHHLSGGHLSCLDGEEEVIVALLAADGTLKYIDERADIISKIDKKQYQTEELNLAERADLLCRETQECLQNVSAEAVNLSSNTLKILQFYHKDLTAKPEKDYQERESLLTELMSLYREILIQCQDAIWKDRRAEDTQATSGRLSGASGTFERLSISVAEVFSDDFLLNQFKDVKLFSENLSEEQMKKALKDKESSFKNLNNVQRVAKGAEVLAHEVVKKFLLELNPDMSQAEQNEWIAENTKDFGTCLEAAKNSSMVTECGDKFGLTVPALIALTELERQTEKNFMKLFRDSSGRLDQKRYQNLKNEVQLTYRRCIDNYYYSDSKTAAPERARACVFEGILSGYHFAAREQIIDNFKAANISGKALEEKAQAALLMAQDCEYGALFHRSGRMSSADYQLLSNLEVSEFQDKLETCSQALTDKVGGMVISQTILNTTEVKENYEGPEAISLSQDVLNHYYRPCMDQQKSNGATPNPRLCEAMITQLTTLQVAKKLMRPSLKKQLEKMSTLDQQQSDKYFADISKMVDDKILKCHDDLKEEYLDHLNEQDLGHLQEESKKTLKCVSDGVHLMAYHLTNLNIQETFSKDPGLSPFSTVLLNRPDMLSLSKKTADCFSEEILKLNAVMELNNDLERISSDCALKTEKEATIIAMEHILSEKLKNNIPEELERAQFISDTMNGEDGLKLFILSSKDASVLKQRVATLSKTVTIRFIEQSIPETVTNYLGEISTPERNQKIGTSIVAFIKDCLKDNEAPTDSELKSCINSTSAFGHQEVIKEIVVNTAKENLQNDEDLAQKLALDSHKRLKECTDKIELNLENKDYDKEIQKCTVVEISLISRDIPREAILSMTSLISSNLSEEQLRKQLYEVDKFYLQMGDLKDVNERDPAVLIYMSLNSCLVSARSELRAKEPDIELAQKKYDDCTGEVEGMIKHAIKSKFVLKNYPGKTSQHETVLNLTGSILIELTGKKAPVPPRAIPVSETTLTPDPPRAIPVDEAAQAKKSNVSKTQELLDTIGENTIVACNYDSRRCTQALNQTKKQVQEYKSKNPNATSKELEEVFINSSFVNLIVEANIAKALGTQLMANLKEFNDKDGILQRKINDITSPEVMKPIMENRYGKAANTLVKKAILEGQSADQVVNNPSLKAALGMALTDNIGQDSFTDQLLYGLVQPTLLHQKNSSGNPLGLFANTKVTFGRLFGVVKGKDFDWQRIRTTPQGQEARRIFAYEILRPVLEGQDIRRKPAGRANEKSLQDQSLERIQNLIEKGIKELAN